MAGADLLVVGGGITGLALAAEAARRGLRTTLIEAGALGGTSTQRSGALVRTHYADRDSARLALTGLRAFEAFEDLYGAPAGFTPTGFAYVPEPAELQDGTFAARVSMLAALGVETELLDASGLARIDPSLDIADAGVVAYEPRSGYADPLATTAALAGAARRWGADLRPFTAATTLLTDPGGRVVGAALGPGLGVVEAEHTVLCAGAHSGVLSATAGVQIALEPTAVQIAFVRRPVPQHLTVIDAPNGIYLRPDGAHGTLIGRRTWNDEPLGHPDADLPAIDAGFVADARRRLALRMPAAAQAEVLSARAGRLDMTPDGLPLVGPSDTPGLWLCCGWSGTGFKTGPSVGAALAEWILGRDDGQALSSLHPSRAVVAPASPRSPH